jgi:hypothetical protein
MQAMHPSRFLVCAAIETCKLYEILLDQNLCQCIETDVRALLIGQYHFARSRWIAGRRSESAAKRSKAAFGPYSALSVSDFQHH